MTLRLYERCARAILGAVDGATIGKLRRDEPKVSYHWDKALAETAALLVLEKTSEPGLGRQTQRRGRRVVRAQREVTLSLVDEALREGVSLEAACSRLGVSPRTVQRWRKPQSAQDRRCGPRTQPANRLSQAER